MLITVPSWPRGNLLPLIPTSPLPTPLLLLLLPDPPGFYVCFLNLYDHICDQMPLPLLALLPQLPLKLLPLPTDSFKLFFSPQKIKLSTSPVGLLEAEIQISQPNSQLESQQLEGLEIFVFEHY